MPAKWKYGFLCDGAMQVQGKWTYQGVFSVINAPSFPTLHPEAVLAFQFNGPIGAHTLRVRFTDSSGKSLMGELRQAIECQEFKDTEVVIVMRPLPLPAQGFYAFKIFLDNDEQPFGVIDLRANQFTPPTPPPIA